MTRPTKFEDLGDYNQQGPKVASLDKGVADGLLDKEGSIDDGDEIIYLFRPTEKDRERKLRSAQYSWDRSKELYEKALIDPDSVPRYMHWNVDEWAKNENKPAIQWPATEND